MVRNILLIALIAVLSACGGDATQTPNPATETPVAVPTVTAQPTQAPDPTPTQEVRNFFEAINANPRLCGDDVIISIPTPDGRWQALPTGYNVELRLGTEDTPPWINFRAVQPICNFLKIEVTQINGEFGYSTSQWLESDVCYLLKLTGLVDLQQFTQGIGTLDDAWVWARVENTALSNRPVEDWFYISEHIWAFEVEANGFYEYAMGIGIQWGVFAGMYEMRRFELMIVPDDYCIGAPVISAS